MHIIRTKSKRRNNDLIPFLKHLFKGRIFECSATLSYYFLFSVFPLALFFSAVFSSLKISEESLSYLNRIVPSEILNLIYAYLREISSEKSFSPMIVGLLLTVYSMSKVIQVLKRKIRNTYSITVSHPNIKEWIISLVFVFLMLISLYASLILIVTGNQILRQICVLFPDAIDTRTSFDFVRTALVTLYLFFVLFGIYYLLPGFKQKPIDALPGTLFTLTAWMIISFLFSFYVDRFSNFSVLYGSLSTIIALITWLYAVNNILLIGANINSYIYNKKRNDV